MFLDTHQRMTLNLQYEGVRQRLELKRLRRLKLVASEVILGDPQVPGTYHITSIRGTNVGSFA